jgi:hypothetical protein
VTRLYRHRKSHINGRIATGISRYVTRADEGLSLAKTRRMALNVIKKLYTERRVRRAIQAPLNIDAATTTDDRGDDRKVLQIICASIDIAMIVGVVNACGRAGDLQLDPEAEIRENGVAENGVIDVPRI